MTTTKAPPTPPLVPAEVDLRDFGFMPLEVLRLRDSDLATLATAEEFRAAVLLWCAAWHQAPAGSLPDNDKLLASYSKTEGGVESWRTLRDGALRGFVKCTDGRLYHPVIAQRAVIAWKEKLARQARTKAASDAKKAAKQRGEPLPPDGSPAARHVDRDVDRDGPRNDDRDVDRNDDRDDGRNELQGKGREGKGREREGKGLKEREPRAPTDAPARAPTHIRAREESPSEPPEPAFLRRGTPPPDGLSVDMPPPDPDPDPGPRGPVNGQPPTLATAACLAMRRAGLPSTNSGDPRLLALLDQGATVAEFAGIAAEAVSKRKGWAWVLTVVQNRRAEAGAIALAPAAPGQPPPRAAEDTAELLAQMERDRAASQSPEAKAAAARAVSQMRQRRSA